jgi:hypothetical protein
MENQSLRRRAGAFFALGVIFLAPTLVKMSNLVDAGRLRWVEVLTLVVGGFASGVLLSHAAIAWKTGRG